MEGLVLSISPAPMSVRVWTPAVGAALLVGWALAGFARAEDGALGRPRVSTSDATPARGDDEVSAWVEVADQEGTVSFFIGRYEATVAEFKQCVAAGACADPNPLRDRACNGDSAQDDVAVNCIAFENAQRYCLWRGGRLPTVSEWELAASGGDGRRYPWGEAQATCEYSTMFDVKQKAGHGCGLSRPGAAKVARKDLSRFGVVNMAGNVAEWVAVDPEPGVPRSDPMPRVTSRVARVKGGSWLSTADMLEIRRTLVSDRVEIHGVGVRCAKGR